MRSLRAMTASPSEIIDQLGGSKTVAERLDRPLTTVASWAARESIPVEVWPSLIDLAKERSVKKVTYESMARAHAEAASRPKRRKAA